VHEPGALVEHPRYDRVAPARAAERPVKERGDRFQQRRVTRDRRDARERIVLGLRDQLAGDELRFGQRIGDDEDSDGPASPSIRRSRTPDASLR